jgi:cytochrome c oxidase cbb3-type subunit IV
MSLLGFGIAGAVGTLLAMTAFLAVVAWAWSSRRKADFESAANMPLEEDTTQDQASGADR